MTCKYCPAALTDKSNLCCDHGGVYSLHVRNRKKQGIEPLPLEAFAASKGWKEYPQLHEAKPRPKPHYDSARLFTREELRKLRGCRQPDRPHVVKTKLIVKDGQIATVHVYPPACRDAEWPANPVMRTHGGRQTRLAHLLPA